MSIAVHIPQFEGPLGLLLFLIRKEEMDIFDIDIYLITSQYLAYIKKMKQFDLEVAGDFVAMAATLIQIKARMLLPSYNEQGEEEEPEDPRKELVAKLLEYQKFKEVSKAIYERPLLGRDVYRRGRSEGFVTEEEGEIIVDEGGLFALIGLYRGALRKMTRAVHHVAEKTQSIAGRILEIKDRLLVGHRVILQDLVDSVEQAKEQLLVTFLSCLELSKMGFVGVFQSEVYGPIYVTARKPITGNVVERVEEYDSNGFEQVAMGLFDDVDDEAEGADGAAPEASLQDSLLEDRGDLNEAGVAEEFVAAPVTGESMRGEALERHNDSEVASDADIEAAERALELPDMPLQAASDNLDHGETR